MAWWQPFSGSPVFPGLAYLSSLVLSSSFYLLGFSCPELLACLRRLPSFLPLSLCVLFPVP